jgi:hypothetical protein
MHIKTLKILQICTFLLKFHLNFKKDLTFAQFYGIIVMSVNDSELTHNPST